MKCIKQSDLEKLIPCITDVGTWDIDDFKRLLDKFGDDYFIEGNEFGLVTENKDMKNIREVYERVGPIDSRVLFLGTIHIRR